MNAVNRCLETKRKAVIKFIFAVGIHKAPVGHGVANKITVNVSSKTFDIRRRLIDNIENET